MQIQNLEISKIKPYEKNAKKHPKEQIKKIAASIKEFGFKQPVVVTEDYELIVGHGRVEAAKALKLKEVPALIVDDLTPEQIKAYRLADNKLNESEWDMDLVIEEWSGLEELKDFTGFTVEDFNIDLPETETDKSPVQKSVYEVIVECSDEESQRKAFEELNEMGYKIRLISI